MAYEPYTSTSWLHEDYSQMSSALKALEAARDEINKLIEKQKARLAPLVEELIDRQDDPVKLADESVGFLK